MHKSEGLIKNSASFKSPQIFHTSLAHLAHDHESLQIARTLFIYLFIYLFNYLIIYFRLVVYIVTCTVSTTAITQCKLQYYIHHMHVHTTTTITTAQLRDNACIQYMRQCFGKKTTSTSISQCKLQYYVQPPPPLPPPRCSKHL